MSHLSSLHTYTDTDSWKGSLYLISMYYKRYEVQTRLTFYWSAGVYAGGFSGVSRVSSRFSQD